MVRLGAVQGIDTSSIFVFYWYSVREITWAYPNNHDHAGYLFPTYDLYVNFLSSGLDAWTRYLKTPGGQGILSPVEGAALCLLRRTTDIVPLPMGKHPYGECA